MTTPTPLGPAATADANGDGHDADVALLTRVRSGQVDAYGPLFDRHHGAAVALARRLTHSEDEAEDVASTAFDRVIRAIENGKGPTEAFRPYLLTAVRRTAWRRTEQTRRERGVDDDEMLDSLLPAALPDGTEDMDQTFAVEAFKELPERWQLVLWHTLVEDKKPGEVAPLLGLSPNATAALAVRAREGLREAYLQRHLAGDVSEDCQFTVDRLGASVRGNLGKRDRAKVEAHLQTCSRCQGLEAELGSVNGLMRSVIGPAVLGIGLADYRAGWTPPADLSTARGISFRWAAGAGAAAVVALTVLGLRTDLGAGGPAQATAFADSATPADSSSVLDVVEVAIPISTVDASECDGTIVPVDLPAGSVITAARPVATPSSPASASAPADTDGTVAVTPISNADASQLVPADADVVVTDTGLCSASIEDLGDVGLVLSVQDDEDNITLALIADLVDDVTGALQTIVDPTDIVDSVTGSLPGDGRTPTVTIPPLPGVPGVQVPGTPDLPVISNPPAVTVPAVPDLPDVPSLPGVGDLIDQLTPGGLL